MATIGTSITISSVGPSPTPQSGQGSLFISFQSPWGIDGAAQAVTSLQQFVRMYGGLNKLVTVGAGGTGADTWASESHDSVVQAYYAVKAYFAEKLSGAPGVVYCNRVIPTTNPPTVSTKSLPDAGAANNTVVTSKWKGFATRTIQITVANPSPVKGSGYAQIKAYFPRANITETWEISNAQDAANASAKSELITITLPPNGNLPATLATAKMINGTDGTPSGTNPSSYNNINSTLSDYVGVAGTKNGLQAFSEEKYGMGYIACPGQYGSTVRNGIIALAAATNRIGLIGAPSGLTSTTVVSDSTSVVGNVAYYWPQLRIADEAASDNGGTLLVDPVGAMAGLGARMIRNHRGPHKSPAGTLNPFVSVLDVERQSNGAELVDDAGSNLLADSFVNTIRVKNGAIVVWGMRTSATDGRFRQFGAAQTVGHVYLTCKLIMEKFTFEPIDPQGILFARVQSELKNFLLDLYNRGALFGNKPGEEPKAGDAFSVVCNRGNNTDLTLNNGELHADVAIVPTPNAEAVLLNLGVAAPGFGGGSAR